MGIVDAPGNGAMPAKHSSLNTAITIERMLLAIFMRTTSHAKRLEKSTA